MDKEKRTKVVITETPHRCCICQEWIKVSTPAVSNSAIILLNGRYTRNREWAHPFPCWKEATGDDLTHQLELIKDQDTLILFVVKGF